MDGAQRGLTLAEITAAVQAGPVGPSSDYDLNPAVRDLLPAGRKLRPAAVLCAFIDRPTGPQVILTRRSSELKHHPGQIAFPGGKVDPTDAGPEDAALRETEEEIGLPRAQVEVIGALDPHETVTGFTVIPYVGVVRAPFVPQPEAGEVEEVFEVPAAFLMQPGSYRVERRRWRGQDRRYYVAPWGPYYVWGATARMLRGLADRVSARIGAPCD
ncbi:MAG: CoA pyrophosphatase [Pseudomonadota bacterium]